MMVFDLTLFQLITICFSAIIIGMSKTGIQGCVALIVPYMAIAFGAKASTGIILPMLCMADIIGVSYYRKTADLKTVIKLLPAAIIGFFVAIYVDSFVPVKAFKILLGATLLLVLSWEIIKLDMCMLPCIFIGATLGFVIVKHLSDKSYKMYIQVVTVISAAIMIFS